MAKATRPGKNDSKNSQGNKPSRSEAEAAVRVLLRWAGDAPERQGLAGTPARVVRAYEEWFSGYAQDPKEYLSRTFDEVAGYDEIVALRDIPFESHCEHHLAPIIGKAHIGYLPRRRVVGISKRTARRCLCKTPPNPRKDDRRSCQLSRKGPQSVWCCGGNRSHSPLHDH